ncbi:MAG: tRNA (adenosine(37)-N6)-dimethylallyltransferase MiaA [candidate division WOR-3 bacterium]
MRVFVLTGPTGVGKTDTALALARRLGLDIVSADSRQVYRGLDIGTAKVKSDATVRVWMVDVADPGCLYSAADFARDAGEVMRMLREQGRRFIVVGGSGFYLRALFAPLFRVPPVCPELRERLAAEATQRLYDQLQQVDPERAAQLHPHDRQRVARSLEVCLQTGRRFSDLVRESPRYSDFAPEYAVLTMRLPELDRRLDERFDAMMERGLIDEVRRLRDRGLRSESRVAEAFGYAELLQHLEGDLTLVEAVRRAKAKTRAYARRQLTWLRRLPDAAWYEFTSVEDVAARLLPRLEQVLNQESSS